jgi:hypothetical protein
MSQNVALSSNLRYFPDVFLEGTRKTNINLRVKIAARCWGTRPCTLEHGGGTINIGPRCSARPQRRSLLHGGKMGTFSAYHLLSRWFLPGLYPESGGEMFLRNVGWLFFSGLHGVISQKMALYIVTAVRTSNIFFTLKMEATCHLLSRWFLTPLIVTPWRWRRYVPPKMSVEFQRTTRRYIPEDRTLHNHRCENLKSYLWTLSVAGCRTNSLLPAWLTPSVLFACLVSPLCCLNHRPPDVTLRSEDRFWVT